MISIAVIRKMNDSFSFTIPYPPKRWIWMLLKKLACFPIIPAFFVILFSENLSINDFGVAYLYCIIIFVLSPHFWYSISAVPISIIIERDESIVLVRRFFWTKKYIFDHCNCVIYRKRKGDVIERIIFKTPEKIHYWADFSRSTGWNLDNLSKIYEQIKQKPGIEIKKYSDWHS